MKTSLPFSLTRTHAIRGALAAGFVFFAGASTPAQTIVDDSGTARNGKVGYWSSIVAGGGDVGISYYCEDDHANTPPEMYTLRFAWRSGSSWQWMTVDQGAGSHSTMRRGSGGLYQIAYDSWSGIGFAVGSPAGWTLSSVDIDPSVAPTNMSLALDSRQRPHIAYMNLANGGDYSLRYTHWDGARWVRDAAEILLTSIWTPTIGFSNTALQLDSADIPHIAFAQPGDSINAWGPIRYASLENGTWRFENLGITGVDPSLAIGRDNVPRMLFNSDAGITYAYRTASGWRFETVVAGDSGDGNSLALSDTDQPFATFGMTVNEDQYLARRDPSGWAVTRIDGDGTSSPQVILGRYGNAIDVDEHGTPHCSYLAIDIYGPTHRCDLKYMGDAGGPPPCIRILRAPSSVTVCGTDGARFEALGASDSTPAYAWEWLSSGAPAWSPVSDGVNSDPRSGDAFLATGAATPTLILPQGGISLAAAASFRCVLTSTCGTATTPPAGLSIGGAPLILTHPLDAQSCGGSPVQFDALADGTPAYQWQWMAYGTSDWLDVAEGVNPDPSTSAAAFDAFGAAGPTLQLASIELAPGAAHRFRCVVTGACGETTTNSATLSGGGGVQFVEQPQSVTLCQGTPATFTVTASDRAASIQWEVFDPGVNEWKPMNEGVNQHPDLGEFNATGANDPSLTLEGFTDDDPNHTPLVGSMSVRCQLAGTCGNATSDAAELSVIACCPGDYNQDGGVDGSDVEAFFLDWEAGEFAADLNHDGGVDGADVESFFLRWEAGC